MAAKKQSNPESEAWTSMDYANEFRSAKKKTIAGIRDCREEIQDIFRDRLAEMEAAENIDEFMLAKQCLLSDLLQEALPLSGDTCIFCIVHGNNDDSGPECDKCAYGAMHGRCGKDGSTWSALSETIDAAVTIVKDNYWVGDEIKE